MQLCVRMYAIVCVCGGGGWVGEIISIYRGMNKTTKQLHFKNYNYLHSKGRKFKCVHHSKALTS